MMKKNHICRRLKHVLISSDFEAGKTTILRVACKKWSCPICGPKLLSRWKHHLLKRLTQPDMIDKQWCFLTITLMPEFHTAKTPQEGVTRLQSVWGKLYMKMRRKVGGRLITYVYFYEGHKDSTYHMHAILDIGLEYDKNPVICVWKKPNEHHPLQRWLKDLLPTIGAGWSVDLSRIRSRGAQTSSVGVVLYAVKYMAKSKSWENFKKGARRVGTSQDIGPMNKKKGKSRSTWEVKHGISRDEFHRRKSAYVLLDENKNLSVEDFEGQWYFPPLDE